MKIMRFRKRAGRLWKSEWRWKEKKIEKIGEYKYLGYVLQRDEGQEANIRKRIKRAATTMRQVWRIGTRRYGKNWGRRI